MQVEWVKNIKISTNILTVQKLNFSSYMDLDVFCHYTNLALYHFVVHLNFYRTNPLESNNKSLLLG